MQLRCDTSPHSRPNVSESTSSIRRPHMSGQKLECLSTLVDVNDPKKPEYLVNSGEKTIIKILTASPLIGLYQHNQNLLDRPVSHIQDISKLFYTGLYEGYSSTHDADTLNALKSMISIVKTQYRMRNHVSANFADLFTDRRWNVNTPPPKLDEDLRSLEQSINYGMPWLFNWRMVQAGYYI